MDYPAPLSRLIDELRALPGIGPKSAQRIAFHLLKGTREDALRLSTAVAELVDSMRSCTVCNAVTDVEVCTTCTDPGRSDRVICVVEEPHNLLAVERTRDFKGRYHVLHGVLSPLEGIGPNDPHDGHELDDVVGANEQDVQRVVLDARDEAAVVRLEHEPGVSQQAEGRLEQAALVGDRDPEALPHRSVPVG